MSRRPSPDAGERILSAASTLFLERGVQAIGLQEIIDACGCGKNQLYRQFGSKDDLIVAYLDRLELQWQERVDAVKKNIQGEAPDVLMAIVQVAAEDVLQPGYRGCPFLNTMAETPDRDSASHRAAIRHVEGMRDLFRRSASQQLRGPAAVADQLVLIVQGMQTSAPVLGGRRSAQAANALARKVISAAQ